MLTLFLFSTSFLKEKYKTLYNFLSIVSFVLAILSRESAIIIPALLVIVYLTFLRKHSGNTREALVKIGPYFIVSAGYLLLRLSVLNFGIDISDGGSDIISRSAVFLKALLVYWKIIFLPYGTHFRLEQSLSFTSGEIFFSGLIIAAIFYFIFRTFIKGSYTLFWIFMVLCKSVAGQRNIVFG